MDFKKKIVKNSKKIVKLLNENLEIQHAIELNEYKDFKLIITKNENTGCLDFEIEATHEKRREIVFRNTERCYNGMPISKYSMRTDLKGLFNKYDYKDGL
jgi:hypothetical protein